MGCIADHTYFGRRCGSLALCMAAAAAAFMASATPLDDYVAKEDPAFKFNAMRVVEKPEYVVTLYNLISQEWLDPAQVDRTHWQHWVIVVVPPERVGSQAMLFINGGSNGGRAGDPDPTLLQLATATKSIIVDVRQIPNQPLRFTGEQDPNYKSTGRSEDALIAYGWDKFLRGGDPIWLARLPMTKAVVRAMDVVQKEHPEVEGFFVVGGSKRGWTTWTVAAVDKRVVGIAPAVIDVLNVAASLDHHRASYGFWAPAIQEYEEMDILSRIHTPEFAALTAIVDPLSYVDRLTMPKYIINSAGDQFFPPDSWKFYFDQLKGEKYLRYMPNTDHGLSLEAYFNMASFYSAMINGVDRPEFSWEKKPDGALEVRCVTAPTAVLLWQVTNPEGRDFRMEKIGKMWTKQPVTADEEGVYRAAPAAPEQGWTAFFLEMEFPNPSFQSPFKFTTGVSILPDVLPHDPVPKEEG